MCFHICVMQITNNNIIQMSDISHVKQQKNKAKDIEGINSSNMSWVLCLMLLYTLYIRIPKITPAVVISPTLSESNYAQ